MDDMKRNRNKTKIVGGIMKKSILLAVAAAALLPKTQQAQAQAVNGSAPIPVANPVLFEDPYIRNEIRPIFMYHNLDKTASFPLGGNLQVYAVQLRYAVNDRLAIIATKDGYIDFNPDIPALKDQGFANLAFGVKYALIKNEEKGLIVTPGLRLEIPTGDGGVFQGNGAGIWNPFVSAGWVCDKWSVLGHIGGQIPNNLFRQNVTMNYGLQVGYEICEWFVPFANLNVYQTLTAANGGITAFGVEGYDLINFGDRQAAGSANAVVGGGFLAPITEKVTLGVAWESGLGSNKGVFDHRLTSSLSIQF